MDTHDVLKEWEEKFLKRNSEKDWSTIQRLRMSSVVQFVQLAKKKVCWVTKKKKKKKNFDEVPPTTWSF